MIDVPHTSAKATSLWRSWRDLNRALFRLDTERAIDLLRPGNPFSKGDGIAATTIAAQSVGLAWLTGYSMLLSIGATGVGFASFIGVPVALVMQALAFLYTTAWMFVAFWIVQRRIGLDRAMASALLIQYTMMRSLVIVYVVALVGSLPAFVQHDVRPELAFSPVLVAAVLFPPIVFIVMTFKMHGAGLGVALPLITVAPIAWLCLAMTELVIEPAIDFMRLMQSLGLS